MSATQEQIEKIARDLVKIKNSNEKIPDDVNAILKYIELLNEVDTTGVIPTVSVVEKENILRKDIVKDKTVSPQDLLKCSNQKVIGNQIAVSNIMK